MSDAAWLIVGLGNPGPQYAGTRHNVGFDVVDALAEQVGARLARHKRGHALAAQAKLGTPGDLHSLVLVEPLSFMNASGGPVKAIAGFYGTATDRIVVVHDELDLDFGVLRVKFGGGDNGHNGLRSLRSSLGSGDFFRVRVGIGRPPGRQDPIDWVLRPFTGHERRELPEVVQRAADAVQELVRSGLEATQNRFNG